MTSICENRSDCGAFVGKHKRIARTPSNATNETEKQLVIEHIRSIPAVESHYSQKSSRRLYVAAEIESVPDMHRLYKKWIVEKGGVLVSQFVYNSIFQEMQPKISFFKPKKDQCIKCNLYREGDRTEDKMIAYEEHKIREKASLEMKSKNFEDNITSITLTFDVQGTITLPHMQDGALFYKRKLNVYNFTIHNSRKDRYCFIFDECNGKKRCSEISSCIYSYLKALPSSVRTVTTWSDTCAAQNSNQYFVAALIYAVNNIPNIETINVKYMESGHSFLECDTMHSMIEAKIRKRRFFFQDDVR